MKKILVVEDDQDIRELLVETLKRSDFEVDTAENGKTGLEKFRKQKYDLILTDIRMPVMDGLKMLKKIKKEDSRMPIVVITAYPSVDSAVECLVEGADDYLVKPIKFDDLNVKIQKALEKRKIQRILTTRKIMNIILIAFIPIWILIGFFLSRIF
ncbi:MAG: response regulator [Prolixibacteraceae bacterium]|nr:response regulator [Prolixibacteraceae bacterium]